MDEVQRTTPPTEYKTTDRGELFAEFVDLFNQLGENRREFVVDEMWSASHDLWSLFFHPGRNPGPHDVETDLLRGAVGLARYQLQFGPKLPPEYTE